MGDQTNPDLFQDYYLRSLFSHKARFKPSRGKYLSYLSIKPTFSIVFWFTFHLPKLHNCINAIPNSNMLRVYKAINQEQFDNLVLVMYSRTLLI